MIRRAFTGISKYILLLLILAMQTVSQASKQDKESLVFGVFPYLPTQKMEQIFSPVAARFSELTERPVLLRSRPDYSRFREQVSQQTYDIILIQPFDYVRAAASHHYVPIARWVASHDKDDEGRLSALFITRPDSNVKNIQDLADRAIATPHPDAAVSLLGRYTLKKFGINAKINITGNHFACLQQVQVKRAEACVTATPPVEIYTQEHGHKFKQIYQTENIPSSLFAIHERVPEHQREALKREMLSWRDTDPTQKNFLSRGAWTRLHPASDMDYDTVRKIWADIKRAEH